MQHRKRATTILVLIAILSIVVQFSILTSNAFCVKSTDLNSDGITDIDDINIAAESFASRPEHARWNPDADIDDDGYIGIKDIISIAIEFGQTSP